MKFTIFILTFSSLVLACASSSGVRYHLADPKTQAQLMQHSIPTGERLDQGHLVERKECGLVRTLYVKIIPEQGEDFQNLLAKHMRPNQFLGLNPNKSKDSVNPCSRVRFFSGMKDIRIQGPKEDDDSGYLTEVTLGKRNDDRPYLDVVHYMKHTPEKKVRVIDPGVFLSLRQTNDLTDEELAKWIIRTLEQVAWKG